MQIAVLSFDLSSHSGDDGFSSLLILNEISCPKAVMFLIEINYARNMYRVPTHTGKTGIPGKLREVFPVREKSGNFKI